MHKSRSVFAGLGVLILLVGVGRHLATSVSADGRLTQSAAASGWVSGETQAPSVPTATLRAASGATIRFESHNGGALGEMASVASDIPHLVLRRNDALTDPTERTLIVELTGFVVPAEGVTVTLAAVTQRPDPDGGGPIPVWHASQVVASHPGGARTDGVAVFTRTFTETVTDGSVPVDTPTDYYRVTVAIHNGRAASPAHALIIDYAFLMEHQWVVGLPEVVEESPGAAPDQLILYYCDMIPFGAGVHELSAQLRRSDVPRFVADELVPRLVEAYRQQTQVWGLPWPAAWTSLRPEDGAERLSVALTDGQTWYHGRAPEIAHSRISLNVGGYRTLYDTLIDGLLSTFHHELFHNQQQAIQQAHGGNGAMGGQDDAWQSFYEGPAVLASSVGHSGPHFTPNAAASRYMWDANQFVTWNSYSQETVAPDSAADQSTPDRRGFRTMTPYAAAMVWRFLYEQCGGMRDGIENPASGMYVVRQALTTLYSGEIVDIGTSTDLVAHLPAIMDRALEGAPCPFQSYEDALAHLARAIYALTLEGGRCTAPGLPTGCGLYDPHGLYLDPPVETVTYTGAYQRFPLAIQSSFGMAFLDVLLDPAVDGQPLNIEFSGAPGAEAEFRVQTWQLIDAGDGSRPRPIAAQALAPEVLAGADRDGRLVATIPAIDVSEANRLGLIITRVDAKERSDPIGECTVQLRPGVDGTG